MEELKQQPDVTETGLVYEAVEVIDLNPIHTKYQKYIDQAKDGYLIGLDYPKAIEILRYCEVKRGMSFGLNMSCSACLIQLVLMFDSLRN